MQFEGLPPSRGLRLTNRQRRICDSNDWSNSTARCKGPHIRSFQMRSLRQGRLGWALGVLYRRGRGGKSEGAIQVDVENGTFFAASDPRQEGDALVW